MSTVIANITRAGLTKGKEYKVIDRYGDSIRIVLDNGKQAFRNVNNFEFVR